MANRFFFDTNGPPNPYDRQFSIFNEPSDRSWVDRKLQSRFFDGP
ncbi:uncharacterized protein METZ01_LOCUS394604 [marine metagenome]|uniref:Uncharacterized protein n=1 Tax=marine metagenome TaxID=408172 RepID=A0A382V5M3_9ZZZZ